ncbi:hypothetical protein [Sandarakinorhabdus oryzae]|uniref:hypothetical protein n=1 Tax=Sandarakinorhabdus oryzae TaxID=2675220 RepID=UPI0012E10692|nr:hypothetical protein [Sandarakinorhabdus oryzae]
MISRLLLAVSAATIAAPATPPPSAADQAVAAATATSRCGTGEGIGAAAEQRGPMVLVPGLTPAHMPVTSNAEAQAFFDQGLGQLWGFDYDEALESFREARRRDPACAMCLWGEALALGPYINSGPIGADIIAKARALVAQTLASPGLDVRSQALAEALHAR